MHGAPVRLRCEHLENPLGIDERRPRLSWWLHDPRPAELQTAFQIIAASRTDLLALDEGDLWDSGRVESSQSHLVAYRGKPVVSGQRVWWKVRTCDSDGLPSAWSETSFFEAGLLDPADWHGAWIAAPLTGSRTTGVPVPALSRTFELAQPPVSARLHIAALGVCVAQINGARVGDDVLTPAWTDYKTRVGVTTYDVTPLLHSGRNTLGVLLADGWFCGRTGLGERQHYGSRPELRAQLNLMFESGASVVVATDDEWRWRPSWILAADPIAGESADGRQHDKRWSTPEDPGEGYKVQLTGRNLVPRASRAFPVRARNLLRAASLPGSPDRLLYGFDYPVTGRVVLSLQVPAGAVIRIRYGLSLTAQGALGQVTGEDLYTACGDDSGEVYEPNFSAHGFRFIEISGDVEQPELLGVSARVLGLPVAAAGVFMTDRKKLNSLYDRLAALLEGTLQSVPQAGFGQAERIGDMACGGARLKGALLAFDAAPAYVKWLEDMADAQLANGGFPAVVPAPPDIADSNVAAGAGAADTFVLCAWQLFRLCGDRRILEKHYPAVCRFIEGLHNQYPSLVRESPPNDVLATIWFFRSVRLAARMAGVLGQLGDLEDFEILAASVRDAFRRRFVTADGRLVGDHLDGYVAALNHGLLEARERKAALQEILRQMSQSMHRHGSDPALVPQLLQTLTQAGRVDLACAFVLNADLSRVDGLLQAGLLDWLYGSLAGMDLSRDLAQSHNAFRHMRIQPHPGLRGRLTTGAQMTAGPPIRTVEAALDTPHGRYEVNWRITDDAFELSVLVPCNCNADVVLPDASVHEVASGFHEFRMPYNRAGDGIPILREVSAGG